MSDQFGGYAPPPPASPPAPPAPPAYGQTPYGAPATPQYQQPYGQPAFGQPSPPPKSGAGLKIALAIGGGVVVILGLLIVIGAVVGGGDKKKTTTLADSPVTTAAPTSTTARPLTSTTVRPVPSTARPVPATAAPTTAAPSTKPAGDSVEISRTGEHAFRYTVGLPAGWDQADVKGLEPELQLTRTTSGSTTGVILVHNLTAETGESITSLQEAVDATKQGVVQEVSDAQIVGQEEHGAMGGEDAAVFAFTAKNANGDKLAGEIVVAVHNGNAFNVVFEATPDSFQTHLDDFTTFLDSWDWKS